MALTVKQVKGTVDVAPSTGATGTVRAVLTDWLANPGDRLVAAVPKTFTLDETGSFTGTLYATDDPGVDPAGVTYELKIRPNGGGAQVRYVALPRLAVEPYDIISNSTSSTAATPTFDVVHRTGTETVTGDKDFTGALSVNGDAVATAPEVALKLDIASGAYERARTVNIGDSRYGVQGGAIDTYDAFMNAGSPVLVSMGIGNAAEQGMLAYVESAGANGALASTVASVDGPNQVTLAAPAVNAVNGGVAPVRALCGWDDTGAIGVAVAAAGTGGLVVAPEGKFISGSITPPDKSSFDGAGPDRTFIFRKPVTLVGNVGSASHACIFRDDGSGSPISDIHISNITFDGSGPYPLTGYLTAAAGGTNGLHQGTRGTADESLMEGVNFRFCTRLRLTNVRSRNCIGDGFDVDQNRDHLMLGCYSDNTRIGFHTSNGTRRGRYTDCTAVYCSTGFDQSTASGHDSVENHYDNCVAANSQVRNYNIMPTTPASCPGNPDGLGTPIPVAPFYGTTLAKYAITSGTPNLTSTVATFTKADRGKRVRLYGAGAAGADLDATIIAFVSATAVTIDTNAGSTVTEAANKLAAYGWQQGTAHATALSSFPSGIDLEDGRTPRAPSSADELRGLRPIGRYKTDFSTTQGGGLGWNGIASDEVTTHFSHNDTSSSGTPRIIDRRHFGGNPEARRAGWGAYRDPNGGVGYFVATSSATSAGAELERFRVDPKGNTELGPQGALATTATDGFPYLPSMPGPPTGTPTAKTGQVPFVPDSSTGLVWLWINGAWVSIQPTPAVPLPANEILVERTSDRAPVNNSGTLVNDGVLEATVAANSSYKVEAMIVYDTSVAAKFRFGFFGPAGARFNWSPRAISNSATNTSAGIASNIFVHKTLADDVACGGGLDAGGLLLDACPLGLLVTAGTAGTFGVRIAQAVPTVYDTVVKTYSFLRFTKLVG